MFEEWRKVYSLPIYLQAGLCLELDGNEDGRYHRIGWWATDTSEGVDGVIGILAACNSFRSGVVEGSSRMIQEVERDLGDGNRFGRWVISLN